MTELQILDQVIERCFHLSLAGGKCVLSEANADCNRVEIEISSKAFAFSLDGQGHLIKPFNSSEAGINKKNDGVLCFLHKQKFYVFLLELKSGNKGQYLKQLKSGKNFVEYLIQQINLFYPVNIQPEYRGVLFRLEKRSPQKQTTRKTPPNFENRGGLLCVDLNCNQSYKLSQLKQAL
ncbi:MAG: hypothetical protein IBX55_19410 [Methyloprofundus sp.]|nr:hypothetical protein [Methyloprofundus sp.]